MREIEIKLKVKDPALLRQRLEAMGCVFSEPISQEDVIYSLNGNTNPWASSKEGDTVIRIRKQNGVFILTLKKQITSELDNLEYETKIEKPEEMHNILLSLSAIPVVEVKKIRYKAKLGEYEVCLDNVETLGDYVEFEALINDGDDPVGIEEKLFSLATSLGLTAEDRETRSYDTIIFQNKNN